MKINIDIQGTIGNDLIFTAVTQWKDYKSGEIQGSKLDFVCVDRAFEKITVKTNKPIEKFMNIKPNSHIGLDDIENLEGTLYVHNGFVSVSFKASDIKIRDDKASLPKLN